MQKVPDNIDLLLPCGESLRGFMEQPFISAADLKKTLRARGIFLGRNEKENTIPVLVCCLLSPTEFDSLRECQATREDNPKTITRVIQGNGNRTLLHAIPDDLNLAKLIPGDYTNYQVIGSPTFVPVGGSQDHIRCEFEIERTDLTRNWASTKSNFWGKLDISKNARDQSITFVLTHTAAETRELNCKLVEWLKDQFKANGDVGSDCEIETIQFSSFDNEKRVAFFLGLIKGLKVAGFDSRGAAVFQVCPDDQTPLPPKLKWMGKGVDDLRLNGRALENTFFIKDDNYHKHLLLHGMEARFKFDCQVACGDCTVVFEFPDYGQKKDPGIEFEVNISRLTLDSASQGVNRTEVKEELLRLINNFKLLQFGKFRSRPNGEPITPALPVVSSHSQLNLV